VICEVAGQYNAQDLENEVRSLWERTDAYRKVRELRLGGKRFFFVDGPPYTTGRIHLGTAWNKVIKDSVLRYRSMNGFAASATKGISRPMGWTSSSRGARSLPSNRWMT